MNNLTFLRLAGWILLSMLFIPIGLAAVTNDHLADAINIDKLPVTLQQNTLEAGNETNEVLPQCLNEVAASVWYQYTATRNQTVVFDTFGSDYDTVLSVWTGAAHPLTQLACDDDSNNTNQSQVSVELEPDITYYINISGYSGENGTLILNALPVNQLENDLLTDAIKIKPEASLSYSNTQSIIGAETESKEAVASCAPKREFASVWYQYTPSSTQRVVFNTIGSDYNTILSVWTGNKHPLLEVACNDDNGMPQSQVGVELIKGKTYYLKITAHLMESGSLSEPTGLLVFNMTAPPANDEVANAIPITESLPYTNTQYTGGATIEIDELFPSCVPEASASVWYLFTPTTDYDNVTFSTAGSGYNTVLSIWQGTEHPFNQLACNDNAMATEQSSNSQITIPLTQNIAYYINVSGVDGEMGNLILRVGEGETDFKLAASQAQGKTIEKCQSTTLTVDLSTLAGKQIEMTTNPVANQWKMGVALPFVYQWYQGESGDESQLVAELEDEPVFTTPLLTETTPYWVRISNPTGTVESDTITVIVKENKAANGDGVDAEGNPVSTNAHFFGLVTTSPDETENLAFIKQTDTVFISYALEVDVNHFEQSADILIVAAYTVGEDTYYFMRNGDMWASWDMDMAQLTASEKNTVLSKCLEVPVVSEGRLENMPGSFTVYVGYRLTSNGNILFSGEPITFSVE